MSHNMAGMSQSPLSTPCLGDGQTVEIRPLSEFLVPWVAIQLEFLGRLTDRLSRHPTGFYTGNAPKYAPK